MKQTLQIGDHILVNKFLYGIKIPYWNKTIIPLKEPARQIVTSGLAYSLKAETLWPEKSRGISNLMTGVHAVVDIGEGQLLCIHTRHQL